MVSNQLKTLNLEIKLPNDDDLHYLQLHSTSTVCTLKSKIFRKATSLVDENVDNYMIVLKQHSKAQVLAEDKIIGSYPGVQHEYAKNKVITLYLLPKNEKCHVDVRLKEGHIREEIKTAPSIGRNHSTKQLSHKTRAKHEEESKGGIEKPRLVRSKSEPILHTLRTLSLSDITSEQSIDLHSYSSDLDSWSEEEDAVSPSIDEAPTSPKPKLIEKIIIEKIRPEKWKDTASKDSNEKANTLKEGRSKKWALWQKESKDIKHRKHASMVVTRTESGMHVVNPYSSPETIKSPTQSHDTADTAARAAKNVPPPVDYSLKKQNNSLVVEEDGGKLVVTAGTVEHLVYSLADRDIPDPAYLDDFFYSMSYFTTGSGVMTHLRSRYEYPAPPFATPEVIADHDKWRLIIQQRVLNVMRYILDNHWYHFERDVEFFPLMRDFVEEPFVRANPRAKGLKDAVVFRGDNIKDAQNRRSNRGFSSPPVPDAASMTASPVTSPPPTTPHHQHSVSNTGGGSPGSVELATHGRSTSSPIIVWRSRRDTEPNVNNTISSGSSNSKSSNNNTTTGYDDSQQQQQSTPTSLTTVASSNILAPPKTLGKRFKDYKRVSFVRVPPLEMARQMTLIERDLFRMIKPPEVAGSAFKKKNKAEISTNVVQMIDWFNHITTWVQKEVVMTPNLKERTVVLAQFIQVASFLRELGNLSGAMQVVCALDTVSVKRLHKTWKGLNRKELAAFTSLQETFGSETNYANYRRLIHEPTNNGLIPYIGLVLQDLLMIEEIPTYLGNGMVNFRKMRRFASVLRSEILERQATLSRFNFEPIPPIQEYLARHTPLSDPDVYKFSRLNEPSKMV